MAWNIKEAVAYYHNQGAPADQTALISLLREVQKESGGRIPLSALPQIAEGLAVKESFLQAVIKRIPSLQLSDTHCLEVCAGGFCGKGTGLAEFIEKTYGKNPEKFELRYVPCMFRCGKGPNIRWDGQLYNKADEALIRSLVEGI